MTESKFGNTYLIFIITLILFQGFTTISNIHSFVEGSQTDEILFNMMEEDEIQLITINNFTGPSAVKKRVEIDKDHGNNDGILVQSEIDSYKNHLDNTVKSLSVTKNTYLDQNPLNIDSTFVTVMNADGLVNSSDPMQIKYTSELSILEKTEDTGWHTLVFLSESYGNDTIRIIAPEGWKVAHSPINFQVRERSPDNNEIIGQVIGNHNAEVKIYDPSILDQLGSTSGEESVIDILMNNTFIFIAVLMAVVIVVLLLRKRNKLKPVDKPIGKPPVDEQDK